MACRNFHAANTTQEVSAYEEELDKDENEDLKAEHQEREFLDEKSI